MAADYGGKPAVEFRKNIDGSLVTVVGVVSDKHLDLFVQTEYAGVKKGNSKRAEGRCKKPRSNVRNGAACGWNF